MYEGAAHPDTVRIAAATVDITPLRPVPLAGFRKRPDPFREVAAPLEAAAAAFVDGERRAVIVTLDALFVGPTLQAALTDHFVTTHRQAADDLLVLATHTHFGPAIDETKPVLGLVHPDHAAFVAARCRELIDRVMAAPGEPVVIRHRRGASRAAVNRRRPWLLPHLYGRRLVRPQAAMAPNPAGPFEPTVRTWSLDTVEGRPVAVIWHYACHPTGFPQPLDVSPDFPGVVRTRLRERHGATTPVLFLQGFAGDIRPRVPETRPRLRRAVQALAFGPSFDSFSTAGWHAWAQSLADDVLAAFDASPIPPEPTGVMAAIRSTSCTVPLSTLVTGEQDDRPVRFQRLQVGSAMDIVAVAAEPLTGLQKLIPFQGATPVGYVGDVFGYWPTDRDARRGGYEVNHFLPYFGLRGRLRRPLDGVFSAGVEKLRSPR
jgi:hypothetical protein